MMGIDLVEVDEFLSPDDCTELIEHIRPHLETAITVDGPNKARVARIASINFDHPISVKIQTGLRERFGFRQEQFEEVSVIYYAVGGMYKPHYDWEERWADTFAITGGPRVSTAITYLNDGFNGGCTFFPEIRHRVTPRAGKMIKWTNVDSNGKAILESKHGGDPVTQGEKWIATQWIRLHKYIPNRREKGR